MGDRAACKYFTLFIPRVQRVRPPVSFVALKMQEQRFARATGQLTVRCGQNGRAHVQMLGQLAKMRGKQKVRIVHLNVAQMLYVCVCVCVAVKYEY